MSRKCLQPQNSWIKQLSNRNSWDLKGQQDRRITQIFSAGPSHTSRGHYQDTHVKWRPAKGLVMTGEREAGLLLHIKHCLLVNFQYMSCPVVKFQHMYHPMTVHSLGDRERVLNSFLVLKPSWFLWTPHILLRKPKFLPIHLKLAVGFSMPILLLKKTWYYTY